jgi:transcriptional regulator with XRE-family HTH domain
MKLEKNLKGEQNSSWVLKAEERKKNKGWFRYAYKISLRIQSAIEDKDDFSQKDLANLLGVSPQYISKVMKGQENLTLETIYKLSNSLGVELISFPDFKYSTPYYPIPKSHISKQFKAVIFKGIVDEKSANVQEYSTVYNCVFDQI